MYLSKPAVLKSKEKYLDIRLLFPIYSRYDAKEYMETYNTIEKTFEKPIKGWNYKKNHSFKKILIQQRSKHIYIRAERNTEEKKKNTGIQFIFQKETTYNDFISIYNIMIKAKQEFFGFEPITNSLFMYYISIQNLLMKRLNHACFVMI